MNCTPAIVIVAYNRPDSLKRLLGSVSEIKYLEAFGEIPLIVSIDHHPDNQDVVKIAEDFVWEYGKKEIIIYKNNLGLRKHILQCGDLTEKYESVIILEDDLFVSPYFYQYACKALNFFDDDYGVGGVSLYHYELAESSKQVFHPLYDGGDNYFMQFPSSWGQAWTQKQWQAFKSWYSKHNTPEQIQSFLWRYLREWPETSWKKYYTAYLVDEKKYFVYPRISLSTNFGEQGTHQADSTKSIQVSLQALPIEYRFMPLEESTARYDSFFELEEESLLKVNPSLSVYSPIEVDLYGKKEIEGVSKEFLLTSRFIANPEKSFGIDLRPLINNIIFSIQGNELFIVRREEALQQKTPFSNIYRSAKFRNYFNYHETGIQPLIIHSLGLRKYILSQFISKLRGLYAKFFSLKKGKQND